jgi:hypothetical protein
MESIAIPTYKFKIGDIVTVKCYNQSIYEGKVVKFLNFENGTYWVGIEIEPGRGSWKSPEDLEKSR